MSTHYVTVQWNRHKRVYDLILWSAILTYVAAFVAISTLTSPPTHHVSLPILLMRALGTGAFILLTITLSIGPACRLDRRFAPLLYNRRHLGVSLFMLGLVHAGAAILFYGGFGSRNPLLALVDRPAALNSISAFPFELLGLAALAILFLMAATSHDFWLKNLTPRWWKTLHMLVYAAYALLVLHITLGPLQAERSLLYPVLLGASVTLVGALHIAAGLKTRGADRAMARDVGDWLDVCAVADIPMDRAHAVRPRGADPVAVYRYTDEQGECVSAISGVCAHQGGPLHEGKIVNGCATCPWHGYQYLAAKGQSPPPFTEKLPTYRVRITNGRVQLNAEPLPPGTPVEPARVGAPSPEHTDA
ncbi:MAG: ferric reductase-like transmembrane domain-containing protein [Phycisphaerales bacterium]